MGSKSDTYTAVLLLILMFFTSVSAQGWFWRRTPPPPFPPPPPSLPPPPPSPPPPPPSPPPPPPPPPSLPFFPFWFCRLQVIRLSVCSFLRRGFRSGFLVPSNPCCRVVRQLFDQQGTTCLCYAARSGFLGLSALTSGDLAQLLFYCGMPVPSGFTCV
ncbi:unnamed protein product [Spirodela intermedia]|uniref:Hydrophobic seed protein domain-containing protein n=1 Tax=Spirodela intermedia TaxID=51605 RepID=A0A7I8KWC9_SPIIN|nr:unnamed protein product [Spirodela intermedia]